MLGVPLLRARMGWPRGPITVPVFFDGSVVLRESLDIARHAETLGRAAPLFPEGRDADVAHWNGLADVISRAGRALLMPRLAKNDRALVESMPPSIPTPLRRAATPVALSVVRYIARKHDVREEAAEQDRATIRVALRTLRERLERGDHVLGTWSYADVALASALQFVRPCDRLVPLGEATTTAWTDEALALEHEDVLAWRDRVVATQMPPRR